MKENIRSPSHPQHRVFMLIRQKNKIESLFPHPSEYLYDAMPHIQGAPPKINHPYNNYNPIGMPKKSNLFTSTNVTLVDQLNTQFKI